ncbi:helix-turn-helix domain-containing protein [Actinoplanes couchii]|uniref:Uncharacterized protein n=1 Tax=Actinoplanes couchii TaxID=403638 RepID=A0ABQ3XGN2_9ACTN|nr:helix-turn-helix domain-containing protein [Actinoplanes couchii]MDR6321119.1 transposase [Actinoplanes couchii]GID57632.1 hypothetical protein Aco03nite_060360 [Actinoplanes couchii]
MTITPAHQAVSRSPMGSVDAGRSAAEADHPYREGSGQAAIVVLTSAQGQPAADIAYLLKATDAYVRDVIHAVHGRGLHAQDPKWRRDTPNRISEQTRDWIYVIARCDPRIATGCVTTISIETVRRILYEQGVSWQTS